MNKLAGYVVSGLWLIGTFTIMGMFAKAGNDIYDTMKNNIKEIKNKKQK